MDVTGRCPVVRIACAALAALFASLPCAPLAAQAQAPAAAPREGRWEPWLAASVTLAAPEGTLTTSYAPTSFFAALPGSGGGQTLALVAQRGPGFEAGLAAYPGRHFGVFVAGSYDHADLAGANGPYRFHLEYVSRPPPDYQPRTVTYDVDHPWPDTSGTLERVTLAAGAAARFGGGRVSGTVTAGIAWTRVSGEGESLAYSSFRLGGHSVLFPDEMHLAFALEGTGAVAAHLGADLDVRLGGKTSLLVGLRALVAGDVELPVRLSSVVNADEVVISESLDTVQDVMDPGPAVVSAGSLRLVVGLRFTP